MTFTLEMERFPLYISWFKKMQKVVFEACTLSLFCRVTANIKVQILISEITMSK